MIKKLLHRLLTGVLLVAATMGSAQAVNFVEIQSDTMRFFYDADFWGNNGVFASGNTISLYLSQEFHIQAGSQTPAESSATRSAFSPLSVFAVRKDGGPIQASIFSLTKTFYQLDESVSYIAGSLEGSVFGGELSNGSFVNLATQGSFSSEVRAMSLGGGTPGSGVLNSIGVTEPTYMTFSAVGISTSLWLAISQEGYGSVRADMRSIDYTFDVSTIPEPHSYAMAMAGLGLVGFVARRRQRA